MNTILHRNMLAKLSNWTKTLFININSFFWRGMFFEENAIIGRNGFFWRNPRAIIIEEISKLRFFLHYQSSYFSENGDVFSVTPSTLFELCDILKIYFIFKQWMLFLWLYVCFRSGIRNTLTLENMLAKRRLSLCEFRRISSAVPCVFMRQTDNLDCNEYSLILAETLISIHNRHVYLQYRSIVSVVIHILAMFCRDWRIDSSSLRAVAAQSEATTDLLHAIRKFARNWLYCRPAEHLR